MTAEELLTQRNARILLGLAVVASGALLLAWQSHLTFFIDDWDLLLSRRGFNAHALLDPHARHLILGPALVYKAIQATLGMDSIVPYAVAAIAAFLASVLLLFVYLSRRVGDWLALAAVLPVLVMGTAYKDLLIAFQICYFGSMAFGLGALLAIERRDKRGDVIACVLLVASLAFAEIAVAFAVGVLAAIVLQRGPWRRIWIVAVPAVLYAIWFLSIGSPSSDTSSPVSAHNLAISPPYVLDGFANSIASLLGLGTPPDLLGPGGLDWGRPLLVGLVALAIAWLLRRPAPTRRWILVPLAVGVGFWFITAANFGFGRPADASRYQYVGAVFVLMIAAALAASWRPGWRAIVVAFAVAVAAAAGNLAVLHDGYRQLFAQTEAIRGGLGGLEIAADRVNPDLALSATNANFEYFEQVRAGPYLSASEKFGGPGYTETELGGASEPSRVAADKVLAAALPISLRPGAAPSSPGAAPPRLLAPADALVSARGSCVTVRSAAGVASSLELPAGGAFLGARGGGPHPLLLRRFAADSFPLSPGTLRGRASLLIPTDRSSRPWQLQIGGAGPVTACAL